MPEPEFTPPDMHKINYDLRYNVQRGTQSSHMAFATVGTLQQFYGEVADEISPPWKLEFLPTNRLLLTTKGGGQFVLYMSDPHADARLCIDDYIPEIGLDVLPDEPE